MTQENPPDNGEGLVSGIFGTDVYEASKPPKREFLPWHRPRKQFVRHYQWCDQVKKMLDSVKPEDGTLKYLGLPGIDLLDLRYFHTQVCQPFNMRLCFLGFNSGIDPRSDAQAELNISLDEVRRLDMIDARSEVIPDDFCRVADKNSMAWKRAKDFGPYDVINLDLCDGFAAHEPSEVKNTHYDAMSRLIALQAKRKDPWLLFLTTRTGKQHVHPEVLDKFLAKYVRNLNECDEFKKVSSEKLDIDTAKSLQEVAETPEGHLTVFLIGLCKWMFGLAIGQNPPSKVKVKSTIGYRVAASAEHDDLISIALRFEPTFRPPNDPLGLATTPTSSTSECELSVRAVKRLTNDNRRCADKILEKDPGFQNKLITETADLLELARYDRAAFYDWVQSC